MTNFTTHHGDKCETMAAIIDSKICSLLVLRNKFILLRASTTISDFIQESTDELTKIATSPASRTAIDTQGRAQEMFVGHPGTQCHIRSRHEFHFARETDKLVGILEEMLNEVHQLRGGESGKWMFVAGAGTFSDGQDRKNMSLDEGKQRQHESRERTGQRNVSRSSSAEASAKAISDQEIRAIGMITIGDWIDASMAERGVGRDGDVMDE